MVNINLAADQIKGCIPALDRRVLKQPFVVNGRNFMLDFQGPYSAFGTQIITPTPLVPDDAIQTFRIEGEVFVFVNGAVLRYNTSGQFFYPVFVFTPSNIVWPWTSAKVGGSYYFARKGHNLLRYQPSTLTWSAITSSGVPSTVVAVTQSAGRLIVLGTDRVVWSALDDGTDLAPSLTTGAGFQLLAMINATTALGLQEHKNGFLTLTDKGILKSEIITGPTPFRHTPLTRADEHVPIDQYCIASIGDRITVFLSRNGFYSSEGNMPQPWQPLMGEYFQRTLLRSLDLSIEGGIRLHYNTDRKWFFVSISENGIAFRFSKAYCYYMPREEWGIFNKTHIGFGELWISTGTLKGFNFGYFDTNGYVHRFSDGTSCEQVYNYPTVRHHQTNVEYPTYIDAGTYRFSSVAHLSSWDFRNLVGLNAGVYSEAGVSYTDSATTPIEIAATTSPYVFASRIEMQAGMTTYLPQVVNPTTDVLDSEVEIGLFRYVEQQRPDELGEVTNVSIGTTPDAGGQVFVDWMSSEFPDGVYDEDYNTIADNTDDEDYGFGTETDVHFKAEIWSTIDGFEVWEGNTQELERVNNATGLDQYACSVAGIYHVIKLSTPSQDDSFHLKTLEISGMLVGVL